MTILLTVLFLFTGYIQCISSSISPKIMGGLEVKNLEEFAYQVAIIRENKNFCGGTILNEENILTASHCIVRQDNNKVVDPSTLIIYASMLKLKIGRTFSAKHIFTYPNYNLNDNVNDIAVIRVEKMKYSPTLQAALLPNYAVTAGTMCNVSGWGATIPDGHVVTSLNFVPVPIYPQSTCKKIYGSFLEKGMICAGYPRGEKDACYGDSGGPLVSNGVIVGVVSWGRSCGEANYPGVYSDVFYYKKWIKTQMERSTSTHITANATNIVLIFLYVFKRFITQ